MQCVNSQMELRPVVIRGYGSLQKGRSRPKALDTGEGDETEQRLFPRINYDLSNQLEKGGGLMDGNIVLPQADLALGFCRVRRTW